MGNKTLQMHENKKKYFNVFFKLYRDLIQIDKKKSGLQRW